MLGDPDGPACVNCGWRYVSPEERALIDELARQPVPSDKIGHKPRTEAQIMRAEYQRAYGRRRQRRARG